ncbi:MAG TPA: alpha/beta fold hydrolase, partial [Saprospiraceae bacterium]|nr:alpha/beta fold hydrolase [Saprospiraceae bacterium]
MQIHRIPFSGGELRYVETGLQTDSTPLILFVHGAPGSGNNFYKYLSDSLLTAKYRLISIDRPGYGYSNYGQSFRVQAEAVKAVLDRYRPSKTLLVGHSFGGPVIAQVALDYPAQVQALLMLAPVNDPDSEPVPWYAGLARWRLTRWMLSKAWQVSGDEKFAHVEELRRLQPRWQELRIPVTHWHGA